MYPQPPRKTVSHACDACRRRKIKCNGLQPCPGCISANLTCSFKIPQKRGGNRGARATVLNELRGSQGLNGIEVQSNAESPASPDVSLGTPSPYSPSTAGMGMGLETITIEACIGAYMSRIHPVVPFLTQEILRDEAHHTSDSLLSRQFIVAFCAYVVTFGKVLNESLLFSSQTSETELGNQLLNAALKIQVPERITITSRQSVFISFFLYGAYAGLGHYRQGWFYLREATTLFMMQRADDERAWYSRGVYGRLFWILVISERAHGIRKNRPITIQVTSDSPALTGTSPVSLRNESAELGLRYLASLFRPFDEVFFAVWNGSRQDVSKEWLLGLERDVRTALPDILNLDNDAIANLRVSQLWLRIKLWELFPRFGFLSSESVYECLTFRYPIVLARDLMIVAMKLPLGSLQVHGVGMTEKIFDIACALADILPFVTTSTSPLELGPLDYLTQTTALLAKLPDGSSKFVPLLLAKVNELVPGLVEKLCEAVQRPIPSLGEQMSPDSRVLFEEEVRGRLFEDLRRGR